MGDLYELLEDCRPHGKGPGRPARHPSTVLHNRILWDAWCSAEGGEDALRACRVFRRGSQDGPLMMRSDEFEAYRAGTRTLSRARLSAICFQHSELADLAKWPIGVFNVHRISRDVLNRWHDQYVADPHPCWGRYTFPLDSTSSEPKSSSVLLRHEEGLYERGDIYGFLVLACIYRIHHADRLADRQWHTARQLIRALPGACRDANVRPHAHALIALTKALLILLPDSCFPIRIDDDLLWEQIKAPVHEPCYEKRRAAARRGQILSEPAPPWVPYTYRRCRRDEEPVLLAQSK